MTTSTKLEVAGAERAFELREELKSLAASATEHFFRMGEIMKEVRDDELWRSGYESFTAYFSDPELDFKKSSVYHSIKLVELFPNWRKLIDVPVSKLIMIAPHVTENNKKSLLADAQALSKSDLHHQLVVKKLVEKNPKLETFPKIYPCNTCSKVKGVDFDALCHCGWTEKQIRAVSDLIDRINMGAEV